MSFRDERINILAEIRDFRKKKAPTDQLGQWGQVKGEKELS
jgi:hypothetical protein